MSFKLHKDIDQWHYWYSPRLRMWCALHVTQYGRLRSIDWTEKKAIKAISKPAIKRLIQDWIDGKIDR